MDTVSILIQTEDVELAAQLSKRPLEFDTQELQIVSCRRVTQRNEANQVIEIILQVTGNIALGIISNWIYDQLKSRVSQIEINRKKVDLENRTQVEQAIAKAIARDE